MKFLFRKAPSQPLTTLDGLTIGQVVRHKVTGEQAVVLWLSWELEHGLPTANVSRGWYEDEEFTVYTAELEAVTPILSRRHDAAAPL